MILLLAFCGVVGGVYLYTKSKLLKINIASIPKEPAKLNIDTTKVQAPSGDIRNILLMGIDTRDPKTDPGHTDSLMILTVDEKHNTLKLTSIMRDSFVNIDGYPAQKITNAHQFGGALLSMKTVNENYNMNITDYIQTNFFGYEKVIDAVGGVPINITDAEIPVANKYLTETAGIEHVEPTLLIKPGLQILNGSQAVAYS